MWTCSAWESVAVGFGILIWVCNRVRLQQCKWAIRGRRFHRILGLIFSLKHWTEFPCSPSRDPEIIRLCKPDVGLAGHVTGGAAAQGAGLSPQLQTGRTRQHDRTRYTADSFVSLVKKTDNKPMYHIETPVYSLPLRPYFLTLYRHASRKFPVNLWYLLKSFKFTGNYGCMPIGGGGLSAWWVFCVFVRLNMDQRLLYF